MKSFLLYISILLLFCFQTKAHQSDFYGKCNKVPLPGCITDWNALTSNDTALYVVGNKGTCYIIYHNGGVKLPNTGSSKNLLGVQFVNTQIGFIWGQQGTLLKTINGGITWESINNLNSDTINKVQFLNANYGYVLTDSSLFKTTDGGSNWSQVSLPNYINDFHFFDTQLGLFCGAINNNGTLYKTTDAGLNWSSVYSDTLNFQKLFFSNNTTYLYGKGSHYSTVLKSANKGESWNNVRTGTSWEITTAVTNFKNNAVFASIEDADVQMYGTPYFGTSVGVADKIKNIYSLKYYGSERLYLLAEHGLYCYMNGGVLYYNVDFVTDVKANSSNPNNTIGKGKSLRFKVTVINEFSSTLINLNGKIRCYSPYITITDSLGTFGTVISHDIGTNTDEFEITLANNIPDDYLSHFELIMGNPTQPSGTWNSIFSIPFIFNPFNISNTIIDDNIIGNSIGNNNSIAEPAETIELTVFADNSTLHTFIDIEGKLISNHNELQIWNNVNTSSGLVKNLYRFGNFSQHLQNIQSTGNYVFKNNFDDTLRLPFIIVFTGNLNSFQPDTTACYLYEFNNILFNWESTFKLNDGYPELTSIGEMEEYQKIVVYPNPNNGKCYLKSMNENIENVRITITNVCGQEIYSSFVPILETYSIDISHQPKGMYYLKIKSGKYLNCFTLIVD